MEYTRRDYPERAWSISKYNIFNQCKRKYYYCTYGHWNGWEDGCKDESKLIYRLTKLQDTYAYSGIVFHEEVKRVIQRKRYDENKVFEAVIQKLRKACYDSKRNIASWYKKPKNYTMLHEYYYGGELDKEQADRIKDRIQRCCSNLKNALTFKEVMDLNTNIIEVDQNEFESFNYNGVKVFAKPDAFYCSKGLYTITDWKTGYPEENMHRIQMLIYLLYIKEKYPELDIQHIRCVDEYLLTGERYTDILSHSDIDRAIELINSSLFAINNYLDDIAINRPKTIDYFPMNESQHCSKCNFIELCK